MTTDNRRQLVADALDVWAPTYPRRVTTNQAWAQSKQEAVRALLAAEDGHAEPFITTYAFPRGHSSEGEIPEIDTLFIDLDFEGGDYDGDGNVAAWRRDLSHLLVRVRKLASFLNQRGADGWRASLSGHKGVHLFLDFPALDPDLGTLRDYKAGIKSYAESLVEQLASETSLNSLPDYVDVTSSDMGRLCRAPNTLHGGATEAFGEARYCVPVTIAELARVSVDDYQRLTQQPRAVPWESRTPNETVRDYITTRVTTIDASERKSYGRGSTVKPERVSQYREQSNPKLTTDEIAFLTTNKPCLNEWRQRDDRWDHSNESHVMEIAYITELVNKEFPINVIKASLDDHSKYDDEYTESKIEAVVARDYKPFRHDTIASRAPTFCSCND